MIALPADPLFVRAPSAFLRVVPVALVAALALSVPPSAAASDAVANGTVDSCDRADAAASGAGASGAAECLVGSEMIGILAETSDSSGEELALNPNLPIDECGGASFLRFDAGGLAQEVSSRFSGAVGPTDAVAVNPDNPVSCIGYYEVKPQFCIQIPSPGAQVNLMVTNSEGVDSVMMVASSRGAIACDDDAAGEMRPMVNQYLPSGSYRIYVGSYSEGQSGQFSLSVSGYVY